MALNTRALVPFLVLLAALPALPQHAGHGGNQAPPDERPRVVDGWERKPTARNAVCPVMGRPVKPVRDQEVVIGLQTYLTCCPGCGAEMAEHRDKYLDADGTPLNSPR